MYSTNSHGDATLDFSRIQRLVSINGKWNIRLFTYSTKLFQFKTRTQKKNKNTYTHTNAHTVFQKEL
jgi:hypothetical protein